MRIARRFRVPLFPISTGKNFGYGGPSPNAHGSVVLDLKRMNRVLEIDGVRNFALVEPGVSDFDLYREVQERGLRLMIDCPDPGWGSPMGNSLEPGIGYTMPHYRDHFGAHCGMEVVLPDGELMHTGMGALPGAQTWQEYPYGFGPDRSGLFAQGNFGIVTKMGFRLMPLPEHYRTGLITVPRRRDFVKLVSHVNYLSDSGLIGEVEYGSPLQALMGNADFATVATKPGGPSDAEMDAAASAAGLPSWQVELQFFGPEGGTLANWNHARDPILADIPGAQAIAGDAFQLPGTPEQMANTTQPYRTAIKRHRPLGVPSLDSWKIVRDDGHVGFFPVLPRTGEAVFEAQRVLADALREFTALPPFFNALTTPLFWHTHTFQMVFAPSVRKNDPEHNAMVHCAMKKVVAVAAEHGWGDYRAAPIYQDDVADTYSFNNHQLRRFHEQLKDAIDPDGIIAPGRRASGRGGSGDDALPRRRASGARAQFDRPGCRTGWPGSGTSAPARPALTKLDHPGRVLFERNCAACHGAGPGDDGSPMLPGTAALERKYRGRVPSALERREGLSAEIISVFVRQGIGAMPPFRRSELSDAQVEAIAAYLEASARVNRPPGQ